MGEYEPDDRRNMDRSTNSVGNAPKHGWHDREKTQDEARKQPPTKVIREEVVTERIVPVPVPVPVGTPESGAEPQDEVRGQALERAAAEQGRAPFTDPPQDDFVQHSPQATTHADHQTPMRRAPVGSPGGRAEAMNEQRQDGYRAGRASPEFTQSRDGVGQTVQGGVNSTNYKTAQQQEQQASPRPGSEATTGGPDDPTLSGNDAVRRAQAQMGEQAGYGNPPRQMTDDAPAASGTGQKGAGKQDSGKQDKGLGYGADGGEEMREAPDVTQRGYGGRGEVAKESER
ncbi:hypothetical protein [Altericroceibacterium xinjiangense]|uniref:hypothetical protein n=1 Tax=Altericroceibacterium xinjiangense TaxID=762261 RepID=UPI000F7F4DCC|nr:hypothetical protein [Altericroceibacterium xinjiangense]